MIQRTEPDTELEGASLRALNRLDCNDGEDAERIALVQEMLFFVKERDDETRVAALGVLSIMNQRVYGASEDVSALIFRELSFFIKLLLNGTTTERVAIVKIIVGFTEAHVRFHFELFRRNAPGILLDMANDEVLVHEVRAACCSAVTRIVQDILPERRNDLARLVHSHNLLNIACQFNSSSHAQALELWGAGKGTDEEQYYVSRFIYDIASKDNCTFATVKKVIRP